MQTRQHFWHTIFGHFESHDTAFYKMMIDRVPGPAHFVEVGSYYGRSGAYMAVEAANSGKGIQFDCVDTWLGSEEHQQDTAVIEGKLFETFTSNMKPAEGLYKPVRMPSVQAATLYEDNSLDFVFIDAAHDYENVKADIIAWLPKVKVGGILGGHDFGHPPLNQAVFELLQNVNSYISCWYVEKTV